MSFYRSNWEILGYNLESYEHTVVRGYNCRFTYTNEDRERPVIIVRKDDDTLVSVTLYTEETECGSGWGPAVLGKMEIEEIDEIPPLQFVLKPEHDGLISPLPDSIDYYEKSYNCDYFNVSYDGGDEYYPSGFSELEDKFFTRNMVSTTFPRITTPIPPITTPIPRITTPIPPITTPIPPIPELSLEPTEKDGNWQVLGYYLEHYIHTICEGHNRRFTYTDEDRERPVIIVRKDDDTLVSVTLYTEETECGSGWGPAVLGKMEIEEIDEIPPLQFVLKPEHDGLISPLPDSIDYYEKSYDCDYFNVSYDGGDEYYPDGYAYLNEQLFGALACASALLPASR